MKDYLCIGQVLDLKKYERHSKISDFKDKDFYIIQVKSLKGNDKEGFLLSIEDSEGVNHNVSTYSRVIVEEIKDLLLNIPQSNGIFEKPIKCKLQINPVKTRNGNYSERYKLI